MRVSTVGRSGLTLACLTLATSASIASTPPPAPRLLGANEITAPIGDGAAALTPDGNTVVLMRGNNPFTLMESHRQGGRWSKPVAASFSGQSSDFDPAMSPDGGYLLFVSNRSLEPGGKPVDAMRNGKLRLGGGMAIWRVDRHGGTWGTPVRLADTVNSCAMTFAPSVAADGSVYYMGCIDGGDFKPMRSAYTHGAYGKPEILSLGDAQDSIRDPAIAPDQSFIVYSIKHLKDAPYRLAISWRTEQGWTAPCDMGEAVNGGGESMGAQISADRSTLYFYNERKLPASDPDAGAGWNNGSSHVWSVSLASWLGAGDHACH
jgi:WD40-like Beta Propeller Repeat